MSQNGPFPGPSWPGGGSDDEQPYREPADPWGDHAVSDPSWPTPPSIPHQPASSFHSAPPSAPPTDPPPSVTWGSPRRNTPIVAIVVVLGLLVLAGLGAIGWLVKDRLDAKSEARPRPSVSTAANTPATVQGSEDARFAAAGQCVQNIGSPARPDMRKAPCASGTYRVLKVIKGKTGGAKDAESKCSKVTGYTNWFYYDSDLDDLDLVLCLRKQ